MDTLESPLCSLAREYGGAIQCKVLNPVVFPTGVSAWVDPITFVNAPDSVTVAERLRIINDLGLIRKNRKKDQQRKQQ